jgi:hypothetical protein
MPTFIIKCVKTYTIPNSSGIGCGAWNYLQAQTPWPAFTIQSAKGFNIACGRPFNRVWYPPPEDVIDIVCPDENEWFWFVNYPDTSTVEKIPVEQVRQNYYENGYLIVVGNFWFPPNSSFYSFDTTFLRDFRRHLWNTSNIPVTTTWGWQGRKMFFDSNGWHCIYGYPTFDKNSIVTQEISLSYSDLETLTNTYNDTFIQNLTITQAILLYYGLCSFVKIPPDKGGDCLALKPNSLTPKGFIDFDKQFSRQAELASGCVTKFGMVNQFEEELRRRIWKIRTDLHNVAIKENGIEKQYPVLADPNQLLRAGQTTAFSYCPWWGDKLNSIIGIVGGVLSLGAPTAISLPLSLLTTLTSIGQQVDNAIAINKLKEWESKHVIGFNDAIKNDTATNDSNVVAPKKSLAIPLAVAIGITLLLT